MRRIERAEALGCTIEVSETLYILEQSWRDLLRAGFQEVYEKEVYRVERLMAQVTPRRGVGHVTALTAGAACPI